MRYQPAVRLLRLAWRLHGSVVGLTLEEMRHALGADGAPSSRATAERSKRALEAAFPQLECANPDEPGERRWRIRPTGLERLAGFGADDLSSLEMARDLCSRQGMVAQARALADLGERLRGLVGAGAAKLDVDVEALTEAEGIAHRPGPRAKVDPAAVAAVRRAIKAMRQVRLTYRGRWSDATSRQRVSPLGLLWGGRNYLLAFSHNRGVNAIRSFALTNIVAVEVLDQPAHRPEGFTDIKGHTAHWFGVWEEAPVDVVLHFARRAAADARDYLFHPSQALHELPRGKLEVRFRAGGLQEMAWHLMTWGDAVTVVAPEKLRKMVNA